MELSPNWTAVETEVARIIAESPKPFTAETVSQIDDFLKYIRGRTTVPEVAKGYWSTLRVMWGKTLEIEVFGDRFEIYKFWDGGSDIRYILHVPGEPFSADLDAELPKT
ncbi:MAG: hypothetical protein Q8K93_27185 [Reyranella sp.]|nr:hypothetical protein [Reyranella sp.]